MTTKLEHTELDVAHFNNFKHLIPNYDKMDEYTINNLLGHGMIQVSTAFEYAVAKVANTTVVSADTNDLDNGNDTKLSTVRFSSKRQYYSAPIKAVHNKTGTLCVQVYERIQDKFYYFMIPKSEHSKVGLKSTIEIPFSLDGTPRKVPLHTKRLPNWWQFEVPTFHNLGNLDFF